MEKSKKGKKGKKWKKGIKSEKWKNGKGGKWEKTPEGNDSIYRRNRRLQGYKGIMDLGARITGGPTRWR